MKLLSVNLARVIWLVPISDFNPKGISLYGIIPVIIEKYKFRQWPIPTEVVDLTKGVVFKDGEFTANGEYPISINFTIFSDGMLADTSSNTELSESFLRDLYDTLSETFQIPDYNMVVRKKLYLSQVYVSTDKSLGSLNASLDFIPQYLSNTVEGGGKDFQVGGISFWPDQIDKFNPTPFTFERTANTPFSENRYYSAAPLQTDQHLELIDKLEEILS